MILLQNKKTLESISCGFDLIGLPVVVMQRLLVEHTGIYQCESGPLAKGREGGEGASFVLVALPVFLPSVICSCF